MKSGISKHYVYSILLAIGAGFLLIRTIALISQNVLSTATPWVAALLIVEMIIDASCLFYCIVWTFNNTPKNIRIVLRLGTAIVFVHAVRVLVFVMGRLERWYNFDVRPEYHAHHEETWTWGEVYFAATMSILSIIAVIIIWQIRLKQRKNV